MPGSARCCRSPGRAQGPPGTSRDPWRWQGGEIIDYYFIRWLQFRSGDLERNGDRMGSKQSSQLWCSDITCQHQSVASCVYLGCESLGVHGGVCQDSAGRDFLDTAQQVLGRKKWMMRVNDKTACSCWDRARIFRSFFSLNHIFHLCRRSEKTCRSKV